MSQIAVGREFVKVVEVGPRDGLQNESTILTTADKVAFIHLLSETGLSVIEATSFVSPKWIPQLADHQALFSAINKNPAVSYPVFVPNQQGMQNALAVGARAISVFTTPSETFCQKNIHRSVAESLDEIAAMVALARQQDIWVRAYVSCVAGCPYEGNIAPAAVAAVCETLWQLGCDEISLGDTIGVGTAVKIQKLLAAVVQQVPVEKLAVHFHDTYGQALVNIYVALQAGIRVIDSSVAGLGGCPYAKGASGNVATEDVLYMLEGLGFATGIDLVKIVAAGWFIAGKLGKSVQSRTGLAMRKQS